MHAVWARNAFLLIVQTDCNAYAPNVNVVEWAQKKTGM